jgi:sugar porter (SP) family MFS transporter
MYLLPCSPRWLAANGKEHKAREVMVRLGNPDPDTEINDVQGHLGDDGIGLKDLLAPWIRPVLLVGIGIMFVQQLTGINTVIYYAPSIFEMTGFSSARSAIGATLGVGVVNVLFTVLSIFLIDRIGRKPLLYAGLTGMSLSLFMLGIAFALQQGLGGWVKWISVGSLFVYIASFAVSLGPIAWLIISEIYPVRIRGVAMSLVTLSNWVFNFIVAGTFLSLIDILGKAGAFWLYSAVGIGGLIFCRIFVPETNGVRLETIEDNLQKGLRARDLGA